MLQSVSEKIWTRFVEGGEMYKFSHEPIIYVPLHMSL